MPQVRLCRLDAVPRGEPKQFNAGETEVLVVSRDGRFYCLTARCTHAGAPLEEGRLEGDVLICPWHGSRFRVTDGSVLGGPAVRPLRQYPSTVRDGYLFVEV